MFGEHQIGFIPNKIWFSRLISAVLQVARSKRNVTILIPCPEYKEMILIALLETNIAIEHCLQCYVHFGKNRGAGLVYHLSSFTCCQRGKQPPLLINQPMGKGHL